MAGYQAIPMATVAAPTVQMVQTATVAAPQMARTPSYVAPPMQVMQQQRPSYVAPPMPMPSGVVVQRPSYVPPPMMQTSVVQRPSYVAPPVGYAAPPPVAPIIAMPPTLPIPPSLPIPQAPGAPPPKLTAGIPDPTQIEKQKGAYAAGLDKQLADAIATVQNETRIEKEMVAFKTQKDIAMFEAQLDEKLVEQLAMEDERAAIAKSELNKRTVERKLALNNQATNLVMDYNMKMTLDDIAMRKRVFERDYLQNEAKLASDFNKMVAAAGPPMYASPMYAAPPGVVV